MSLDEIMREHGERIESAHAADTFGDYTGLGLIADFVYSLTLNGYEIVRKDS